MVLISCTDDQILDLEPQASLSDEVVFSSPANIAAAMNGMYQGAQIGFYNGAGARGYVWGAAVIQQNDMRGEDVVNTAAFYQITYENNQTAQGAANTTYYWFDGYRLINRCNLIIEGVTKAVANGIISEATGNDYIGQAKFMRAITHFELLMFFARPYGVDNGASLGIPYSTIPVNTLENIELATANTRESVASNYTNILADLQFAEDNITTNELVRASKSAAIGFKAKVKLHMRDFAGVLTEVDKITGYSLMAEPSGVFTNYQSNSESIFSILQSDINNPGVNGAIASQYKGRGLGAISPILWNDPQWLADDKRRKKSDVLEDNGDVMVYERGEIYTTNKYRKTVDMDDYTPILRYADILLIKAEAEARVNGLNSNALDALNAVRNRALADPANQSYTLSDFSNVAEFVAAVIKERRIEFLMEGKRWADIHRLQQDPLGPLVSLDGIPAKYINGDPGIDSYTIGTMPPANKITVGAIPYSDYRFIWPIPVEETVYNPNIAQNPGY